MADDRNPTDTFRRITRWATTPPQAYGVYFLAVVVVFLLSFYAGTMRPKTAPGLGPPPASAPRP